MSGLPSRKGDDYPQGMPLPSWAADAAVLLCDTENLVILEGNTPTGPAIFIARLSVVEEATRIEFQILAQIVTTDMMETITVSEDGRVHGLREVARLDSNEAESG